MVAIPERLISLEEVDNAIQHVERQLDRYKGDPVGGRLALNDVRTALGIPRVIRSHSGQRRFVNRPFLR